MIKICQDAFDPWHEVDSYQRSAVAMAGKYGATGVFVGTMRDFNEGDDVDSMILEHYPGMTEKYLEKIVADAMRRWQVLDTLVLHRVGAIESNQPIVLVAVWSARRGDAFDACRAIMEALKTKAPFWKKEYLADGRARWVESNSDGYI
ncbi:MAG: molybdopterin converting factor [Gammaproteobacteria bacterium HGW-Gammaproteobacteria-3]|jgi:molybdopterin synthase catalytic subunit|nr:MAG: molybdopterin converting factor [Gammaproteobacteria bacterium HGW-Gammaproteobacteria-3]